MRIPLLGVEAQELIETLAKFKSNDVDWKRARSWSLVYYGGELHTEFLKQVYAMYFSENGAGPTLFPSLKRMEAEVVAMVTELVNGGKDSCGTMTSGGTESILLAMKAYRDQARDIQPHITAPELLVPESAHPAFLKAAAYFDLKVIPVPLNDRFEVEIDALCEHISDQTICIVASAPSFPHGVLDPIAEMGEVASTHGIGLHVDACLGGLLLPFIRKIGREIPRFGFDVSGVTSISTDLHKNGYAAKGASAILYSNKELRRYQFFISTNWPGGMQASPTMLGTRPGGAIAAAWAALMVLGERGYIDIARRTMDVADRLVKELNKIPGVRVLGAPVMSVFGFTIQDVNVFAVGDRIDALGWRINRQNYPPALHVVVTPNHEPVVSEFITDLTEAIAAERRDPTFQSGKEAILYGGTAQTMVNADIGDIMISKIEENYTL